MDQHSIIITVVVPLVLFAVGFLGKALVRGAGGYAREDLYLGSEALLVALTAGLTYSIDVHFKTNETNTEIKEAQIEKRAQRVIVKLEERKEKLDRNGLHAFLFAIVALPFYLFLLKLEQDWKGRETPTTSPPEWWQFWSRKRTDARCP
jgi:hypothetical protein